MASRASPTADSGPAVLQPSHRRINLAGPERAGSPASPRDVKPREQLPDDSAVVLTSCSAADSREREHGNPQVDKRSREREPEYAHDRDREQLYHQQIEYFAAVQAAQHHRLQQQQHAYERAAIEHAHAHAHAHAQEPPHPLYLYNAGERSSDAYRLAAYPLQIARGHSFSGVAGTSHWDFAGAPLAAHPSFLTERANSMPGDSSRSRGAAAAQKAAAAAAASTSTAPAADKAKAGGKNLRPRASVPFVPTLDKGQDGMHAAETIGSTSLMSMHDDSDYDASYDSGAGQASTSVNVGDEEEPEVFKCPHCDKQYTGKHARSIWRRHLQDKHAIPLSLQPRRTRWDGDANRPKNAEERRARMLESKRRWARKKRLQDKAVSLGLPPDSDINAIRQRLAEMPNQQQEYELMNDEGDGFGGPSGMAYGEHPTFAVGARMLGPPAHAGMPAMSQPPPHLIHFANVQQQADDSFFRHAAAFQPEMPVLEFAPGHAHGHRQPVPQHMPPMHPQDEQHRQQHVQAQQQQPPQQQYAAVYSSGVPQAAFHVPHQRDVFAPPPGSGFPMRPLDPAVTPVQHYAMLHPTPPSTGGPSSAEKDLHALKHKMLAEMYGSRYKPATLSPPASDEKAGPTSHQQQQAQAAGLPQLTSASMAAPSYQSLANGGRASVSAEATNPDLEHQTDPAAATAAPTKVESPTQSPLTRARSLARPAMSPRSNSISGPLRSSLRHLAESPRRHASLEPVSHASLAEGSATALATSSLATVPLGARFSFERSSPRANPFSLEQHKVSPVLSRRAPGLSPPGGNADLPLAVLSPLRVSHDAPSLLGVDLKLPPLVATPAREFVDPLAGIKRSPENDEEEAPSADSDAGNTLKRPRLADKDLNISPARPSSAGAPPDSIGTLRSFFTPFSKSTLPSSQGTFDSVTKSVRASLGMSGASRPWRRDDLFSSPQHLGLTSSLGLAPQTVLRNATATVLDVETPVPAAKAAWPATALKGSTASPRLRYASSNVRAESSSSPRSSGEDLPEPVASQQRKLNNENTPSKRSQTRAARASNLLDGSPKRKVTAAI